ncbi:MAG TPA: alpha/beta family hydrolase [Candidatus Binataceae bacterium]|nr:alpha/beta family hydrolase [Candidatus Binataceae bacterium]
MKEQQITFRSGELTLEGLLAIPSGAGAVRGGVVCHPHPLYGGSMYNNVVDAALTAMWNLGWATLRFNFRGVGASEGEHGGGAGEAADAAAAVQFLSGHAGVVVTGAVLAGYSFGAMAAAAAAPSIDNLAALALIALPLRMADTTALERFKHPIILAAGDRDGYCPVAELETLHRGLGARSQLKVIAGADHFFGGFEEQLTSALESMLHRVTTAS